MIIWIPVFAIALIAARLATRYLIHRESTDAGPAYHDDRSKGDDNAVPPKTPETKAEMMRQQVIAKIHWGARDGEVYGWLQEHHGITGREADELLAQAHRAKRKAIRSKAAGMLAFSGCGVLLAGGFIAMQLWSHVFWFGWSTIGAFLLASVSIPAFLRNLWLLFSGKLEGSVD